MELQNITAIDAAVIDRLFATLLCMFPSATAHLGPNVASAKRIWLEGLVHAGISTTEQLNRGIAQARASGRSFMPSMPEFIQYCLSDPNMPNEISAWSKLQKITACPVDQRDWASQHPAIFWSFRQLDWSTFNRLSAQDQRKQFARTWEAACKLAGRDFPFPPPPSYERKRERPPRSNSETARRHVDAILGMFSEGDGNGKAK